MLLHKPTDAEIRNFIARQSELPFSYSEVGASRSQQPPAGYAINRYKGRLGTGEEVFNRAVAAMRSWTMYRLDWTKLCWPDTPIKEGKVVAILAKHFGFWSLNACRIIYTFEEAGNQERRFGFAFGTLPGHVEEGEERFSVELEDETVWYRLFAFARPKAMIARMAYPLVRSIQSRFAVNSFEAMRRACRLRNADLGRIEGNRPQSSRQ